MYRIARRHPGYHARSLAGPPVSTERIREALDLLHMLADLLLLFLVNLPSLVAVVATFFCFHTTLCVFLSEL